jgi:hypothetical protein
MANMHYPMGRHNVDEGIQPSGIEVLKSEEKLGKLVSQLSKFYFLLFSNFSLLPTPNSIVSLRFI